MVILEPERGRCIYNGQEVAKLIDDLISELGQGNIEKIESPIIMDEPEYIGMCNQILKDSGWTTQETKDPKSFLIENESIRILVFCIKSNNVLGKKNVLEVSQESETCSDCEIVIVSDTQFTKSAQELAKSKSIALLDTSELKNIDAYL
jgi:hypothetical protein